MTDVKNTEPSAIVDSFKWLVALALILGGLVAYYVFTSQPIYVRAATVGAGMIAGLVLAAQTIKGGNIWHFIRASRVEMKKVVWPTRHEALQTTIVVIVFTVVFAIFFAIIDSGLTRVTSWLIG